MQLVHRAEPPLLLQIQEQKQDHEAEEATQSLPSPKAVKGHSPFPLVPPLQPNDAAFLQAKVTYSRTVFSVAPTLLRIHFASKNTPETAAIQNGGGKPCLENPPGRHLLIFSCKQGKMSSPEVIFLTLLTSACPHRPLLLKETFRLHLPGSSQAPLPRAAPLPLPSFGISSRLFVNCHRQLLGPQSALL